MSLQALGLNYVDLYLVHWPIAMNPDGNDEKFPKLADGSRDLTPARSHTDTYKDMEKLLESGKVKAIGVANYSVRYLEELLRGVSVFPAVNQIENHPLLPQQEIVNFCRDNGIHVTAYSPLGSAGRPLTQLPVVRRLAEKRATTPAVVLLSWHGKSFCSVISLSSKLIFSDFSVSSGRSVLAKSVAPSRIEENCQIIELDESELGEINQVVESLQKSGGSTRYVYPAFGVDLGYPDKS
ncbi:Uncharacterized protein TPAR_02969 [Tolypocladium paradoxum]|uniref:NADP-dependent oxidoreductase domain-containing protein n=1 Tax=Tolypocladium paradoxum TaxID=94208 RepID=A0A2S4L324_9HYPO|nr:Uncharacterized protein TPAR_02969 [Tolypocladium paradoxum]